MAQDIMEEQDIVYDRTMTVEEAIEILNSAELYGPVYEATQVIIKALSEQSLKHGHWTDTEIEESFGIHGRCSVCGKYATVGKYCLLCGAIMDKESE